MSMSVSPAPETSLAGATAGQAVSTPVLSMRGASGLAFFKCEAQPALASALSFRVALWNGADCVRKEGYSSLFRIEGCDSSMVR